jgi:predicted CXXCH cytochrome family protein
MAESNSNFGPSILSGFPARAMNCAWGAPLFCLFVLLLHVTARARTIEHPGILHKEDNCSSCHADKTSAKFVHSAMEVACTVCHLAQTQGDMTTLQLALPKEEICFSCHEKSMMLREHPSAVKRICVDCHDAHSSTRRMLLREPPNANGRNSRLIRSTTTNAIRETVNQP